MYQKIKAIVLGTTRHTDRISILTLYTPTHGRISLVAPGGGTSRTARTRRASLMPLSLIEADINFHNDRTLQRLGQFTLSRPNTRIIGDPFKSAIALFIADFLNHALREGEPDPALWDFLDRSVATLDATPRPANFHLAFLARFARYAGIMPDVSDATPFAIFDLREGRYTDYTPPHPAILADADARAPLLLSKLSYANFSRWHISHAARRRLLDGIITYYAIHLPGIDRINSLPILRQLFE